MVRPCACSARRIVPEIEPRLRVETDGRLVEKDHARLVDQRPRDHEALLLAARKLHRPCASARSAMPELLEESPWRARARHRRARCRNTRRERPDSRSTLDRCRDSAAAAPRRCAGARASGCVRTSSPPMMRLPAVGSTRVVQMPSVVVFPAPLGPSRPKNSPVRPRGPAPRARRPRCRRDDRRRRATRPARCRARRGPSWVAWSCTPCGVARCEWRRQARTKCKATWPIAKWRRESRSVASMACERVARARCRGYHGASFAPPCHALRAYATALASCSARAHGAAFDASRPCARLRRQRRARGLGGARAGRQHRRRWSGSIRARAHGRVAHRSSRHDAASGFNRRALARLSAPVQRDAVGRPGAPRAARPSRRTRDESRAQHAHGGVHDHPRSRHRGRRRGGRWPQAGH